MKTTTAKRIWKQVLQSLSENHNIIGSQYTYKKGECSCCYGHEESSININVFINNNKAWNWSNDYYKISHEDLTPLQIYLVMNEFNQALKDAGENVVFTWSGNIYHAIMSN